MARRAVLIESSDTMRKILAAIIMAHHNDVSVIDAVDCEQAKEIIAQQQVQMIVYNWDGVSADYLDLLRVSEERALPVLVLVADPESATVTDLLAASLPESHIAALTEDAIAGAINRVCDPRRLRASRRYSIPGTIARLRQGEITYFGVVINISAGGMLCDIEYAESFRWDAPTEVQLDFPVADGKIEVGGIAGGVRRLAVLECEDNGQPVLLRLAYAFGAMAPAEVDRLLQVLTRSGSMAGLSA
ncbi:MAG: PilZ domain-containing protein [Thermodesulfobacteriota bacterium]